MQKQYRLNNEKTFNILYRKGIRVKNDALQLIYLSSKYDHIKVGVVCSKKIGNAVTRNKVRRRLKEIFRHNIPNISSGYTYLITAFDGITKLGYNDISERLLGLLKKANKLK